MTSLILLVAAALTMQAQTIFYPASDPEKDIAAALASARQDGRHVLVDFGADWCPDCRVLGALFEDPVVAPFAKANFHVVHVDVGRRDKNGETVAKYKATSGDWIPAVVVLDPTGKTVAITDAESRLTRRTSPQELLTVLQQWAPKTRWADLGSFTEDGVTVTLALERDSGGRVWLAGTFAPTEPGTHVYGKDLPLTGIDGLGRPTLISVSSATGLKVRGSVIANRPIEIDRLEALNTSLPIYPPGPVTLRVPVDLIDRRVASRAEISVSYMACGPKGCRPPVMDRRLSVTVPGGR
jgi:thiol-disulfide isomerase/thioredoxin